MRRNFENDLSAAATVTGTVKYMIQAVHTSGYVVAKSPFSTINKVLNSLTHVILAIAALKDDRTDRICAGNIGEISSENISANSLDFKSNSSSVAPAKNFGRTTLYFSAIRCVHSKRVSSCVTTVSIIGRNVLMRKSSSGSLNL